MANVWINEFHYDNNSGDMNEFIEIAGLAGTNLTGWTVVAFNGNGGAPYATLSLSGTIADTIGTGHGFLSFTAGQFAPVSGTSAVTFQNGGTTGNEPDGFAIIDNNGNVVEFISYEGVISTTYNGQPITSTNITDGTNPVFENGTGSATGSIQRQGTGYDSSGFTTWAVFSADNSATQGSANSGQTFTAPPAGQTLFIAADSASKSEGDDGTTVFTFTVTRANPDDGVDVTVDWNLDGLGAEGWASANDFTGPTSGTLTFGSGQTTQQISISVRGDAVFEANERFSVLLSNISAGAIIGQDKATATIVNDDPIPIYQIQGNGHTSDYAGKAPVTTRGVITGIQMTGTTRGFYIQDVNGDGDATTSDAIFVFRGSNWTPDVEVGDMVSVTGGITEYRPSGSNALTLTQFGSSATVSVLSKYNALPDAVVIGPNGLKPPTGDVASAAAFYEALEGMRVTVEPTRVVGATNNFGEIYTIIEGAYDPSSLNGRGGLTTSQTDFNPERIQFDNIRDSLNMPMVDVGARLAAQTGIMSYGFGTYEVLIDTTPVVTAHSTLQAEQTDVTAWNEFFLSFGNYNVENLDINDNDGDADVDGGQFAKLAQQIVKNMGSPHVLALQELQDDSGTVDNGVISADRTLQKLVDEIVKAGGPRYQFAYLNPEDGEDGGAPGGNIRQAFLYNADAGVKLVEGSLKRITDPDPTSDNAFQDSRKPLAAQFSFNGENYTFVNNHLNSKGGDDPIFSDKLPPTLHTEAQRIKQAQLINAYVDNLLAADGNANIVVLGDLNDFSWSNPLRTLDGSFGGGQQVLWNLAEDFISNPLDRTDYVYEGNSQSLDHIYVSAAMRARMEAVDIVRINSEFDVEQRASDHDALVARSTFRVTRATANNPEVIGDEGSNALIGNSTDNIMHGGAGRDYLQGDAGNDLLIGGLGADGLFGGTGTDTASYAGAIGGVIASLAAPSRNSGDAAGDTYNSIENLLGSAFGDMLAGNTAANVINGGTGADAMMGGLGDDTFIVDDLGDTAAETAQGGIDRVSTSVNFTLSAEIENLIATGSANLSLAGNALSNTITGNAGANKIYGGFGNDQLRGGSGKDAFVFDTKTSKTANVDSILDFNVRYDSIYLDNKIFAKLGSGSASRPKKFTKDMFVKGTEAQDAEDRIVFNHKTGGLYYDRDGTGSKEQVKIATLQKHLGLTHGDFYVI
jgi:predicted extracellular nuclease